MTDILHGGKRTNAGRKPSGKVTEVIRVDIHRWHVLRRIEKLDEARYQQLKAYLETLEHL